MQKISSCSTEQFTNKMRNVKFDPICNNFQHRAYIYKYICAGEKNDNNDKKKSYKGA